MDPSIDKERSNECGPHFVDMLRGSISFAEGVSSLNSMPASKAKLPFENEQPSAWADPMARAVVAHVGGQVLTAVLQYRHDTPANGGKPFKTGAVATLRPNNICRIELNEQGGVVDRLASVACGQHGEGLLGIQSLAFGDFAVGMNSNLYRSGVWKVPAAFVGVPGVELISGKKIQALPATWPLEPNVTAVVFVGNTSRRVARSIKSDDDQAAVVAGTNSETGAGAGGGACHRYVITGAETASANGEYIVMTGQRDSQGQQMATPGRFQLCSVPPAGGPHYCDKSFELYSMPAWPAAGTWRVRGWSGKVEFLAASPTPAGGAPSGKWKQANGQPSTLSLRCNRTADATFRPPQLVPVGIAELVWNQTAEACPGVNRWGHVGEAPDSMPIAWHNPITNKTSLISANDWGTFAGKGNDLGDAGGKHDCSHRIYTSINASLPSQYASHQWLQSARVNADGSGFALIHSEFHGDVVGNFSLCSWQRGINGSTGAPNGGCQYWSTGLGFTKDGGDHWQLVEAPPKQVVFATPRKYTKDSDNTGFGALGGLVQHTDGFYYGHVNQINAGWALDDANASGICAFRTHDLSDPRAFRGWNGSEWSVEWADAFTTPPSVLASGQRVCAPLQPTPGGKGNGHPQMRELAGDWRPDGWPSHIMLGWPEGGGQKIAYAYPETEPGSANSESGAFTRWTEATQVDLRGWISGDLSGGENLMYPSLLDADSPFALGHGTAAGLSYSLVGNASAFVYFVIRRTLIARVPVAFVPWFAQAAPEPFPPPPPSPLNPKTCTTFAVTGAGDSRVDGVYKQLGPSHVSDHLPIYQKDPSFQLYHYGHWKIAHLGVGPVYCECDSQAASVPSFVLGLTLVC